MLPAPISKKKSIDLEIFNKFSHVANEVDKRIIFESQINASGIEALDLRKKTRVLEGARKLSIRESDEL